jgi:hypothetical protein
MCRLSLKRPGTLRAFPSLYINCFKFTSVGTWRWSKNLVQNFSLANSLLFLIFSRLKSRCYLGVDCLRANYSCSLQKNRRFSSTVIGILRMPSYSTLGSWRRKTETVTEMCQRRLEATIKYFCLLSCVLPIHQSATSITDCTAKCPYFPLMNVLSR